METSLLTAAIRGPMSCWPAATKSATLARRSLLLIPVTLRWSTRPAGSGLDPADRRAGGGPGHRHHLRAGLPAAQTQTPAGPSHVTLYLPAADRLLTRVFAVRDGGSAGLVAAGSRERADRARTRWGSHALLRRRPDGRSAFEFRRLAPWVSARHSALSRSIGIMTLSPVARSHTTTESNVAGEPMCQLAECSATMARCRLSSRGTSAGSTRPMPHSVSRTGPNSMLRIVDAVRPRNGVIIEPCANCQASYAGQLANDLRADADFALPPLVSELQSQIQGMEAQSAAAAADATAEDLFMVAEE